MPISWNEIRHNAIAFARDWAGVKSERAEKQTFWNEFFKVFGISRRTFASFEEPVRRISGEYGYIDLLWPGMLLVEHKSRGQDLGKAESQAFRYIHDLLREGREDEVPRYVIVSDFARIAIHRRQSNRPTTKELAQVPAYFGEIRQPDCSYLLIPSVSSERRRYIPIGFMRPEVIASNLVLLVPGARLYHFGVLSSRHAHGLGASGERASEVGLPLFQQDSLQQFSLAHGTP